MFIRKSPEAVKRTNEIKQLFNVGIAVSSETWEGGKILGHRSFLLRRQCVSGVCDDELTDEVVFLVEAAAAFIPI